MVPLNCGVCSLWVGLDQWLVEVSWLGELVSVFRWVCWIFSPWGEMKCPVGSLGVFVSLVWLWETCLLMFGIVFPFCWRISVMCFALELVGCWVDLGCSVGVETFGELLSINVSCSQEFSDVLKFWN